MDVEDIVPGQHFAQTIDQRISDCQVVLVIVGPRWMEILRERSHAHQEDYVRREIVSAIAHKITLIPVLVGGASMAQFTDVPAEIAALPFHHAAELRDATFKEDCDRLASALRAHPGLGIERGETQTKRKKLLMWIGVSVAVIGLLVVLIGPWSEYQARRTTVHQLLATARTQMEEAEYESAFRTTRDALKLDAANRSALDLEVDAAMLWLRNFRVIAGEGQKADEIAGPALAEIKSALHAGLARTKGQDARAADILAHLGWAHWLNQRLAHKEFGPAAEQALRKALSLDPLNVYANSMLGNWLLQTNGSLDEALRHFVIALESNRQRSFIRQMQLGGMIYNDNPGVRAELIKVANQMRLNSEPIDERYRQRILSAYSPTVNDAGKLKETLSAIPPSDAWATFLWLDHKPAQGSELEGQRIRREFIQASILEIEGKTSEALLILTRLERELKLQGYSGRIVGHVVGAIKRLAG